MRDSSTEASLDATRRRDLRTALYLFSLVSGACGLVYEVLWVRELTLILGVSARAVATVLAAFMAGLALGSILFGAWARRSTRPLLLYSGLELGIGVFAVLLPFGFSSLGAQERLFAGLFGRGPLLLDLARFSELFVLLAAPSTLMGATIPVLSRLVLRAPGSSARDLGKLYALNTLGAVLGALAAGFVLLPGFGLRATTFGTATANILLALGAGTLALLSGREGPGPTGRAAAADAGSGPTRLRTAVLVVSLASGFCALGYEVLWSRTLTFYVHNSTYAFTAMLACFLVGIGLGSLSLNRLIDRAERPGLLLGFVQIGIGLTTLLGLWLYPRLPRLVELIYSLTSPDHWWKAVLVQHVQAALILVPATFLMGLSFPLATRVVVRRVESGSWDVGLLYALNTAGAIAGSILVGFASIPGIGLVPSFLVLTGVNVLAGLLLVTLSPGLSPRSRAAAWPICLAVAGLSPLVVPSKLFERAMAQGDRVLFYEDSAADTVMVRSPPDSPDQRAIYFSDGRGTAGTHTVRENRIYGHLPMLLHGSARKVLSVCFGVGNTLAGILKHPGIEHVDLVELSPSALRAAALFPTNEGALADPRVEAHVEDGRRFLLGSEASYDLVQLEPPEIHTQGVVFLYTREFYDLVREHLNPGGLLCQWANIKLMPILEQKMLIRTFIDVFPEGTVWMPGPDPSLMLLIGGRRSARIDYQAFARAMEAPEVKRDLALRSGLHHPLELLLFFRMGPVAARAFSADVPLITDDRTFVDFSTPRSLDANYGLSNAFSGLKVAPVLPGGWSATTQYYAEKLEEIRRSRESVFPFLEGFGSEEDRERVRSELARGSELLDRAMQEDVRAQLRLLEPTVNQ